MKLIPDNGAVGPAGADRVALTSAMQEYTFFAATKLLDLTQEWWVRFWLIDSTERHSIAFVPGKITAVQSKHAAFCLWKPK